MAFCWERAVCTVLLNAVLIIACVPFPFFYLGQDVIVSVSDHCLVITFIQGYL